MMNDKEFENEFNYAIAMHYMNILKGRGIITEEEFKNADKMLLKKYSPIIGSLLSDNFYDTQNK